MTEPLMAQLVSVKQASTQFHDKLLGSEHYYIALSDLDANIQIVKIVAPATHAPAQVRAYMEVLVAEISRNMAKTPHLLDEKTEPLMAQGPIVEVTNSSFLGNYEKTKDYQLAYNRYLESKKLAAKELQSMQDAEIVDIGDCGDMGV